MPRKGENVRKRKDGRWEGRYSVKDVYCGTTCVHSVYAKSYNEVRRKLAEARRAAQTMTAGADLSRNDVKTDAVAEEWLDYMEKMRKHSTCVKYRNIYKGYIRNIIGNLGVTELNTEKVKLILTKEQDISSSIQRSIVCVTNQLLKYISSVYSVETCRLKSDKTSVASKPIESFEKAEQIKLISYLYDNSDIYKTGIMLCLATGLRLGEVCALKWEDIDLESRLLHVNRTVQRIAVEGGRSKTALVESEPKSSFSKRAIPLADTVIKWLSPYYHEHGYVLRLNRPMEPRTYQNKYAGYLQYSGVKKKNFHVLRHTFATNCVNSGMDVKSLSEIMGHSDVKITLNRYVHPTMDTKRRYINTMFAEYDNYTGKKDGQYQEEQQKV